MIKIEINRNKNYIQINDNKIEIENIINLIIDNNGNINNNLDKIYNNYTLSIKDKDYKLAYNSINNIKLFDVTGNYIKYNIILDKIYVVIDLKYDLYIDYSLNNFLRQLYRNKELLIIDNDKYFTEEEKNKINKITSVNIVTKNKIEEIKNKNNIIVYFDEKTYYDDEYIDNLYNKFKNSKINIIKTKFEIIQSNTDQYIRKLDKELKLAERYNKEYNEYNENIMYDTSSIKYIDNAEIRNSDILYKININKKLLKSYYKSYYKFNKINYYFDKIYIINLERRKDRYKKTNDLLNKFNIKAEFIKAYDGIKNENEYLMDVKNNIINIGGYGRIQSLLMIIQDMRKNKYKNILILEDDIYILKNFVNEMEKIMKNIIIKNKEWDMLFLGVNYNYKNIKQKIFKIVDKVTGGYAVGISYSIIDDYEYILRQFNTYIDTEPYKILKYKYRLYGIYPNLIILEIKNRDIEIRSGDSKLKILNNWDYSNYIR